MIAALERTMTQGEIRKQTGISQPFISDLKRGHRRDLRLEKGFPLYVLYAERVLNRRLALVPVQAAQRRKPTQAARRCA